MSKRTRKLPEGLILMLQALPDDQVLAVHDLTHKIMEERWGTSSRPKVGHIVHGGYGTE